MSNLGGNYPPESEELDLEAIYGSPEGIFEGGVEQGAEEERKRIKTALHGKCSVCEGQNNPKICADCKFNPNNCGGLDYWVFAY